MQQVQEAADKRGLAHARAAGDDRHLAAEGDAQGLSLLGREADQAPLLHGGKGELLVVVHVRTAQRRADEAEEAAGGLGLGVEELGGVDDAAELRVFVQDDSFVAGQARQCVVERLGGNLEPGAGLLAELAARVEHVPLRCQLGEGVQRSGLGALRRIDGEAERLRDAVGGAEADPPDVEGEPVGVLAHQRHGAVAVALEDPAREGRRDAVALQEDHRLARVALLRPGLGELLGAGLAEARDAGELPGVFVEDLQRLEAEGGDDARGEGGADALHQTGGQVALDAAERARVERREGGHLELLPVTAVLHPAAHGAQGGAAGQPGQVADERHQPPLCPEEAGFAGRRAEAVGRSI